MFKSINVNITSKMNNWLESANRQDLLAPFVSQDELYFGIESSSAEAFFRKG